MTSNMALGTGDSFFDEQWSHWPAGTIPGTRHRISLNRELRRRWELDR